MVMEFDMKIRSISLGLFCCVAVSSCDEAKSIAVKAKDAVEQQVEKVTSVVGEPAAVADSDLEALVDHTPEGYLFRKNLPFPQRVKVKTVSESTFKGRSFQSSILGSETGEIDGTFRDEVEIERNGAVGVVTHHESRFTPRSLTEDAEPPESKVVRPGGTMRMEFRNGNWSPARDGKALDFSRAADMAGRGFDDLLLENGLNPRPFWFGKRRLKIGDSVTLTKSHLGMLLYSETGGRLDLKLERIEAIHGHPCGVFSVTGNVMVAKPKLSSMGSGREDITIESGNIWMSLLYPIVLKEDVTAVVSSRAGDSKSNLQRTHGTLHARLERKWTILPDPAK